MLKNLTIRGFKQGDEKRIVRIHRDSIDKFESMNVDDDFILRLSQRHDFQFFIADINGLVVGFLGAVFYSNVGRSEVGPIAVEKYYRNSGVGSKLLDNCENFLKTAGIRRITARVRYDNNECISFFRKHGFEQEAVLRRYTRDLGDVVQFVRFI